MVPVGIGDWVLSAMALLQALYPNYLDLPDTWGATHFRDSEGLLEHSSST